MRKAYRYRHISYLVADESEVHLTVEFISDGNFAHTLINVPGPNDPEIENSGTALIGYGKDLRSETTIVVSDIINPIPEEDEIRVQYKINGETVIEHTNPKSDEERPYVILFIRFLRP